MIGKICIIGSWFLLVVGASLIGFGLAGISVPLESTWHLEFPLVLMNLLGGITTISLGGLVYHQINKYEVD